MYKEDKIECNKLQQMFLKIRKKNITDFESIQNKLHNNENITKADAIDMKNIETEHNALKKWLKCLKKMHQKYHIFTNLKKH